jgi:hypothetical protein
VIVTPISTKQNVLVEIQIAKRKKDEQQHLENNRQNGVGSFNAGNVRQLFGVRAGGHH